MIYINLIEAINIIFRKKLERSNAEGDFQAYFYRFIGIEDKAIYNNILKTLDDKIEENKENTLFFDGSIPMIGEMELIQYVYNELNTMNISNIQNQDITLFDDLEINKKFLHSLNYVVQLSIKKESFFNENIRNNFITKLIVWTYSFVRKVNFYSEINPKCIYYGNITRHEIYFLIMLNMMKLDVIYINPLKEEFFEEIDEDKLSTLKNYINIEEIETFKEKSKNGQSIDSVETITKYIQKEVQENLFNNSGIYRPWQFRNGYTKSLLLDTVLEDIYIYWNEVSKVRPGFDVENNLVKVPCFFYKIDGQFNNKIEFQKLVKFCSESKNTLFFNHGDISRNYLKDDEIYSLMFCQLSDGTFDIEEIKKLPIYRFGKYSNEIQNFILNKFNEVISKKDIFNVYLDKEKVLKFLAIVLSMDEQIVRSIDNFDFTSSIPKIVIYLNNECLISDYMVMLLAYLHTIGIDIVIFNPAGLFNINNILKYNNINVVRLEQMNYTSEYGDVINLKKNFISKILKI